MARCREVPWRWPDGERLGRVNWMVRALSLADEARAERSGADCGKWRCSNCILGSKLIPMDIDNHSSEPADFGFVSPHPLSVA